MRREVSKPEAPVQVQAASAPHGQPHSFLAFLCLGCLPGILRLRSQVLPMVAMEGACLRRVILSFMRPSPVTFTVKGLPVREKRRIRVMGPLPSHQICPHQAAAQSLTRHVFVSKLDVDNVGAGFRWTVGDFACPIFHILTVNVHLARTFDAQP